MTSASSSVSGESLKIGWYGTSMPAAPPLISIWKYTPLLSCAQPITRGSQPPLNASATITPSRL
jgi:hypothetical protein